MESMGAHLIQVNDPFESSRVIQLGVSMSKIYLSHSCQKMIIECSGSAMVPYRDDSFGIYLALASDRNRKTGKVSIINIRGGKVQLRDFNFSAHSLSPTNYRKCKALIRAIFGSVLEKATKLIEDAYQNEFLLNRAD